MMPGDSRQRTAEEWGAVDRLSNLPKNLIEKIIGRMPIRDAVRTSNLSSKWRYIWAEYRKLVLDKQFYTEIMRNKPPDIFQYEYVNIVSGILLQHLGPILNFVLDIPELHSAGYSNIDQWMLFLSRKDVSKLTLRNRSPNPYKIPSHVFSNPKLAYVNATNCIFSPPKGFECFRKLTHIVMKRVTFTSSVLNIPQLVKLAFIECSGIRLLCISAPLLQQLMLLDNDDLDLSYYIACKKLECCCIGLSDEIYIACKKLECCCIGLSDEIEHHELVKNITLWKLLGCWPELRHLSLDGAFLMIAAGNSPERLPVDQLNSLEYLSLSYITYHWVEIACILCLLNSTLNLSTLKICADNQIVDDEKILNYLKEPGLIKQSMTGLQTVVMNYFQGSKCELLLVKLLLAYSPSLERMCIEENQDLDPIERLKTSKDLMRFSRASTKAEIIFQPGIET